MTQNPYQILNAPKDHDDEDDGDGDEDGTPYDDIGMARPIPAVPSG